MNKLAFVFTCLFFSASFLYSSVTIDADNENIQYVGRFDFSNSKSVRLDWSAASINAVFTGTSIQLRMTDNRSPGNAPNANRYSIFIDSAFVDSHSARVLMAVSSMTVYTLATGLADTSHTITIRRRNESPYSYSSFQGFVLDDGKTLLAPQPRPSRRIECIGDSYTAGYGNLVIPVNSAPADSEHQDADCAFGPIVARYFNADYSVIGISGIGMAYSDGGGTMPPVYQRSLYSDASKTWDFNWQPNAIILYLGTNDYRGTPSDPSQVVFETAYVNFLVTVSSKNPNAHIFCMYTDLTGIIARDYIKNAVNTAKATLNTELIHYVSFYFYPTDEESGSGRHPNYLGAQRLASLLEPYVAVAFSTASVDITPPSNIANVYDGTGADIGHTPSLTQLSANWTSSADAESGVSAYWYAIGSASGATDVVAWTSVNTSTYVIKGSLILAKGTTYYFSVYAVNGAGLHSSTTTSNGQYVENTAVATYLISGTVKTSGNSGITGVALTLTGTSTGTQTTWLTGTYIFGNLTLGTYTLTPIKTGYTFTPANRVYTSLSADQTNQDSTGNINVSTPTPPPTDPEDPPEIDPPLVDAPADSYIDFEQVKLGPNPVTFSRTDSGAGGASASVIKFTKLPTNSQLMIYTISGKLVRTMDESNSEINFDGKNTNGDIISQGIYIYCLKDSNGNKKSGKIAVKIVE